MRTYVNIRQLSVILDSGTFTIYSTSGFNKDDYKIRNKNYKIDLDKVLKESKVNKFEFLGDNFIDRMKTILDPSNLPNYISTYFIVTNSNITYANLLYARRNDFIKFITNPNSTLRNKTVFLYEKHSLLNYMELHNKTFNKCTLEYSKQFYSISEVLTFLKENQYNISKKSLYRYIHNYEKIPCIKMFGALRIPILEFHQLDFETILSKFKDK